MSDRAEPPTHWPALLAAAFGGVASAMNVGKVRPASPVLRAELGLRLVRAGWVSSVLPSSTALARTPHEVGKP